MIKIIQITDCHLLANRNDTIWGLNVYEHLQKISDIISKYQDIDCIIITGDIADRGEYDAYMNLNEILIKINVPIYWLQGNHDLSEVMLQVTPRVQIKSDKSFIIRKTKFILLQSIVRDEDDLAKNKGRGHLFDYEIAFLIRELEEYNFEQCVVALHHPPVLSNSWIDRRILDNRLEFISILEKYPKVKIVLYGHQHLAQHTILNGIHYISAPPVSFNYNPDGEKFSLLEGIKGFGIIEILDDARVLFSEILC